MAGNLPEWELWREFEDDPSIIYVLDRDFRIRYCNAAWDRFALENRGAHLARALQSGANVMTATAPPLRPFYARLFGAVLQTGEQMHCVYECSSDISFRRFHMLVSRKRVSSADLFLVVVNSLVEETVQPDSPVRYDPDSLRDSNGFITMCSHCRRTQLPGEESRWAWLQDLVREMPDDVSHSICPVCFDLHYRS